MCERNDTVSVVVDGEPRSIDRCIAPIVEALNRAGVKTAASCCGHGIRPGNIAFADGRELVIVPDYETGRRVDKMFPPLA